MVSGSGFTSISPSRWIFSSIKLGYLNMKRPTTTTQKRAERRKHVLLGICDALRSWEDVSAGFGPLVDLLTLLFLFNVDILDWIRNCREHVVTSLKEMDSWFYSMSRLTVLSYQKMNSVQSVFLAPNTVVKFKR